MKRTITLFAAVLLLAGCTQPKIKKAEPLVEAAIMQTVVHPETYKPISTKLFYEGKVHESAATYWEHIPYGDSIDVVVLQHLCSHDDRTHHVVESSFFVIMSPDMETVYYTQWDNGTGLPWER